MPLEHGSHRHHSAWQGWLLAAVCLAPVFAKAAAFQPYTKLDIRGANQGLSQQPSTTNLVGSLALIPAWKPMDKLLLLPLMNIQRVGKQRIVAEDEPYLMRTTFWGKPSVKYLAGAYDVKAWGSAKRMVTGEYEGQAWTSGKYDSEEFGGGLGAGWKGAGLLGPMDLGLEWQHRSYQNNHTPGAGQNTKWKNYYAKDYDGWKINADLDAGKGVPVLKELRYTGLFKNYVDSLRVRRDGTLDVEGGMRWDQLHKVKLSAQGALPAGLSWDAAVEEDLNLSNQNFFDSARGVNLFIEDFYGYHSTAGDLSLTWASKAKDPASLSLGYRIEARAYTGRLIRNPDRSYAQGKQADLEHTFSLDGRYPLITHVAVVGGGSYNAVQSNTGYIPGLRPTFDLYQVSLGLEFKL